MPHRPTHAAGICDCCDAPDNEDTRDIDALIGDAGRWSETLRGSGGMGWPLFFSSETGPNLLAALADALVALREENERLRSLLTEPSRTEGT